MEFIQILKAVIIFYKNIIMDKKWSQIEELNSTVNKTIKLCSIIKENNQNIYSNKVIDLNTIISPIVDKLNDLNEKIINLQVNGTVDIIGNESGWVNEENTKVPNLSIAKELNNKINNLEDSVLTNEDIDLKVPSKETTDILKYTVEGLENKTKTLENNYREILSTTLVKDNIVVDYTNDDTLVPSASSVYNLQQKVETNSYNIDNLLKSVKAEKQFIIDNNITEDTEVTSQYSTDCFYINIEKGSIFQINNNKFERVSIGEHINSNEIFNDYLNHAILIENLDNYSSIHNQSNQIGDDYIEATVYFEPDYINGEDGYCYILRSDDINVLDYVGQYITFEEDLEYKASKPTLFPNTFKIQLFQNNPVIFSFKDLSVIEIYGEEGSQSRIYSEDYFNLTEMCDNPPVINGMINYPQKAIISKHFKVYNDSDYTDPIFLTGLNNIAIKGNQHIVGKYNSLSDGVFIVGGGDKNKRKNLFEIFEDGTIYGRVPLDSYTDLNYVNISNLLSDLVHTINIQKDDIYNLSETIDALSERISALENA